LKATEFDHVGSFRNKEAWRNLEVRITAAEDDFARVEPGTTVRRHFPRMHHLRRALPFQNQQALAHHLEKDTREMESEKIDVRGGAGWAPWTCCRTPRSECWRRGSEAASHPRNRHARACKREYRLSWKQSRCTPPQRYGTTILPSNLIAANLRRQSTLPCLDPHHCPAFTPPPCHASPCSGS